MVSLSLAALEVDLVIIPFFCIFLLMLLPVPLLSQLLTRFVASIERVQFLNMSILLVGSCLSFIFFSFSLYKNMTAFDKKPHHEGDLAIWLSKRRHSERNMYLHCLCFVLIAAVWKLARLNLTYAKISRQKSE